MFRVFIFLLVCSTAVSAEDKELSLADALNHLIKTHPVFSLTQYNSQLAHLAQQQMLGAADWRFDMRAVKSRREFDREQSNGYYEPQYSEHYNFSINKQIWYLGARLNVYHFGNKYREASDELGNTVSSPRAYSSTRINVKFPMLKNIAGTIDRFRFERQGFIIKTAELNRTEAQELVLLDLSEKYIRWSTAENSLSNAHQYEQHVNMLDQFLQKNQQFDASSRMAIQMRRARASVDLYNRQIHSERQAAKLSLLTYLGLDGNYIAKPELEGVPDISSVQKRQIDDTHQIRTLKTLRVTKSRLEYEFKVANNRTKPEFNLLLNRSISANNEVYSRTFNDDVSESEIGVEIRYPLGGSSAEAQYLQARLQKNQIMEQIQNHELELTAEIKAQFSALQELQMAVHSGKQRERLTSELLIKEMNAFKAGEIDISAIINQFDKLFFDSQQYARLLEQYQYSSLVYMALIDQLWDGSRFKLSMNS